ncbi:MAG: hypothetical protein ACI4PJ_03280 [Acutalibacteraceae bacterium]
MPEKEDGIEKKIKDYFAMMAKYGEELQKYLQSNRDNYEKLFKAKWEMVEAKCKKTGEELLKKYKTCMNPEECFGGFIEYAQEAQKELEKAITDYHLKCNGTSGEGSKLFKEIQEQENKIKNETKKNPKIKILDQTCNFDTLLMSAGAMLRLDGKVDMFNEFKNKEFVKDVIEAFN